MSSLMCRLADFPLAFYTARMRRRDIHFQKHNDGSATPAEAASGSPLKETAERGPEKRNFLTLVCYQIAIRTGWIFKTESIIMPAVLDSLGGGGWLRGCLPLVNRFGQSVPPLLMARRVKIAPYKKWVMAGTTLVMSLSFFSLAATWWAGGGTQWWLAPAFLLLYTLFFISSGVNHLVLSTLQGKLVQVTSRGRLLLISNVAGSVVAIGCAAALMPLWLHSEQAEFQFIFAASGIGFAAAALISLVLREPADDYQQAQVAFHRIFGNAGKLFFRDANFRRLLIIGALFGTSIMLFPHYQALARGERVQLDFSHLMVWVVVQNAGTALCSLVAGPVADRKGNRLVLRLILLGVVAAPLLAIFLSYQPTLAQGLFPLVFLLVGLTPVVIRTLHNYTLEICEPAENAHYLATLNLFISVPIFLSPLVGLLVDMLGFEAVFLSLAVLSVLAWLITFRLQEPRFHPPPFADEDTLSEDV